MHIKRVCGLYFSPTGGTEEITRLIAGELARHLERELFFVDFTRPENRQADHVFTAEDLVVVATPVYAGRIPNKILPDFSAHVLGCGSTPAVPLCVFGNRSFDEALRELTLLLEGNGFLPAGAAAFVCRHAFSDQVGAGRPGPADRAQMADFAAKVAEKLSGGGPLALLPIDRGAIGPYYTPLKTDGTPARFLKAKPITDTGACTRCGLCAQLCPVHSIDGESMEAIGLCIKCQACIRRCPSHAKHFTDPDFLSHRAMLEEHYTRPAENVTIL